MKESICFIKLKIKYTSLVTHCKLQTSEVLDC